jgi:hypothetical protein
MAAPDNFTVTTWQAIYAANKDVIGNNPNLIYPGQVLTLSNDITYTVASGDNLTKIAAGRGGGSYGTPIVNSSVTQEILPPTPVKSLNSTTEADTTGLDQGDTIPNSPDISPEDKTEPIKKIVVDKASTKLRWKEPRDNPLSDFSSYTYNISLYVVNPETYNSYTEGSKIIPSDWKLICRSGGIGDFYTNVGNVANRGSARAEGFELDYYIDNLRLTTNIAGQETKRASSTYEFSFQVFEPYGFKFPTKLVRAANQAQKSSSIRNTPGIKNTNQALQSIMMLVIRFYGYNKDGELVTSTNYSKADSTVTDTNAVFERSFPIKITGFEFKLDSKIIYNIKAVMVSEDITAGKFRGFIDSDTINLKGRSVADMLEGSSTSNKEAYGLIEYLNNKQEEYLKNKQIQVKDSYSIEFQTDSIKSALMVKEPKSVDRSTAPLVSLKDISNNNARTAAGSPTIDTKTKTLTVTKGVEILRVIDQIITQSSYITNAFKYTDKQIIQEPTDPAKNFSDNSDSKGKELVWYSVTPQVKVKTDGWDELRNSYAYDITYIIRKYTIPYVRGLKIAKPGKYDGPVKRYKHLYLSNDNKDKTKHQKEIISYDQQYNLLYFNAGGTGSGAPMPNSSNSAPVSPGYVSGTDKTGASGDGWWDKSIGPVKTFLYSPGDQLNARITILGDPDYLVTATARGVKEQSDYFYGEDGFSINPHAGQVFIEVDFRDTEDYNKQTGLLDPAQDDDILFWPYPDSVKDKIQGVAYMVTQVVSNFSKGLFTQDLKTVIPPFDTGEDGTSSTTPSDRPKGGDRGTRGGN